MDRFVDHSDQEILEPRRTRGKGKNEERGNGKGKNLASESRGNIRNLDLRVAALRRSIDSPDNAIDHTLNARPARGRKNNDGDPSRCQILLMAQIRVRSHESIEAIGLGRVPQFTVRQLRPPMFVRSGDLVLRQKPTQR